MLWVFDVKDLANLVLSDFGRCCGQPDDARVCAKFVTNHFVEDEVSGPEVVRPLGGTVDLVDADHADLATELR